MDDIPVIKEIANLNIVALLDILGVQYKSRGDSYFGPCPVHNGDRPDAWSWEIKRGIWKCFSSECDREFGADIFGLVQGMRECGFRQAKNWVKSHINCKLSKKEVKEIQDARSNRDFVNSAKRSERKNIIYNPSCLDRLEYHSYLEGRGFERTTVEKYNAGVGGSGRYMSNRIVFPIFNIKEEIVGFTGRTLFEDWSDREIPKWKHSKHYNAECNLFNINHAYSYIKNSGDVIIVEGPLDVLRLEEAGVHNSVAVLGKSLHNGQMTMLMEIPTFKLKVAFDADKAGKGGAQSVLKRARCFFDVNIIELPEGKDVGDLTDDEVGEFFK